MTNSNKIFFLIALLFFSSCGKSKSGDKVSRPSFEIQPEGIYSTNLLPVNNALSDQVKGIVTVSKYGDDLNVRVSLKNPPKGLHVQGIYSGVACPEEDLNGDGYIDIKEAQKSAGQMLMPFDGDLSGQVEGNDYYPTDSYKYERSTSYQLVLSDLRRRDFKIEDMVKLKENTLKLEGRVVVVLGVSENQKLPETVATLGTKSPQRTIPIACGILSFVPEGSEPDYDPLPTSPIHVRPRPHHDDTPTVDPVPQLPENNNGRFWHRLRNRLERWWNRLGRWWRGENDQSDYQGST